MEFVHVEAKATLTSHPHSTRLVQSPRHIQLLLQWRLITSGMPYPAVHLLTSYLGHCARLARRPLPCLPAHLPPITHLRFSITHADFILLFHLVHDHRHVHARRRQKMEHAYEEHISPDRHVSHEARFVVCGCRAERRTRATACSRRFGEGTLPAMRHRPRIRRVLGFMIVAVAREETCTSASRLGPSAVHSG